MPRDVGGWAKKNTHQVFGLERLHKVSCVAGAGWGSQTRLQQKAGDQSKTLHMKNRRVHNKIFYHELLLKNIFLNIVFVYLNVNHIADLFSG